MYLGYGILGLIIGVAITGGGRYAFMGAISGVAIGLVVARLRELERRITDLESGAARRRGARIPSMKPPATEADRSLGGNAWESVSPDAEVLEDSQQADRAPASPSKRSDPERQVMDRPARPAQPSILQTAIKRLSTWLTTGNVPVKVGVIISFIGVAFLLKYAIDREIVKLSLEMRIVAVALAGVAMLAIGWRLRDKARVYALSMQGGGVGILFLTVLQPFGCGRCCRRAWRFCCCVF